MSTEQSTATTSPANAEHCLHAGSTGGLGECSASCACGATFDGFDTYREAADLTPGTWIWHDGSAREVLSVHPYTDGVAPAVLLVLTGKRRPIEHHVGAVCRFQLVSPEEIAEARAQVEQARMAVDLATLTRLVESGRLPIPGSGLIVTGTCRTEAEVREVAEALHLPVRCEDGGADVTVEWTAPGGGEHPVVLRLSAPRDGGR